MEIKQRAKWVGAKLKPVGQFFKASVREWLDDKALRHAAALAYYSVFSLAPLLVIAIAGAGFFFGEQAVEGQIVDQLQDFVGAEPALFIENMLREARETGRGLAPTLISVGTMLFGALVIFSALQDVLNMIWGVEPDPEMGLGYTIRRRILAFVMVLFFGIAMIATFLASFAFTLAEAYWEDWFGTEWQIWGYTDQVVWLVFFTVIFGMMYKILPDVRMAWRDVWVGAFMTSILFSVGLFGISTYMAYSGVGTVFGAAGTLAVILVWIYYSWTIVLMGAEMTQVWARKFGRGISPGPNAVLRVERRRSVRGKVKNGEIYEADADADESENSRRGDNGDEQDEDKLGHGHIEDD